LRLSESLYAQARLLAEQEGIPINQLIATSLAGKMSALLTSEYLEARAAGLETSISARAQEGEGSAGDCGRRAVVAPWRWGKVGDDEACRAAAAARASAPPPRS